MSSKDVERALAAMRPSAPAQAEDDERLATAIGYTRKHGGLPATRKSLGQNWLTDEAACATIAAATNAGPGDLVLEIGPGPGGLTEHLLQTGTRVLAVDIDSRMIQRLHERWQGEERFSVVHANILDLDLEEVTDGEPFVVVGNLPYNITSALLFKLIDYARENPGKLRRLVVMVQWEVASRITAKPGSSEYSVLGVFLRTLGEPEIVTKVDRQAFHPPPKVDAGVIGMDLPTPPPVSVEHWPTFKRLVKGTFSKRRKMLRNSMPGVDRIGPWQELDFDWTRRPQTLSALEFAELARQLIPKSVRREMDDPEQNHD